MYKILAETLFLGKELIYVPSCHSTNDLALEKLKEPDTKEGLLIVSGHQLSGRGQRGNVWQSVPNQNLLFSLILKPKWLSANKQFYLNIISSLAIKKTIEQLNLPKKLEIKWPNDILIGRQKVAGILIENSLRKMNLESSVVGIGLNVNQKHFEGLNATSLRFNQEIEFLLSDILKMLILQIEKYYLLLRAEKYAELKAEYLASLYGFRQEVRLRSETEFVGQIIDVDDDGMLSIIGNGVLKKFNFKEIEFLFK